MSVFRSKEGRDKVLAYYNRILAAFPVKQNYIKTQHGKTFIIEAGSCENETVLLLHGSCGNSAFWLGDIFPLAEKYHVVSADIIGDAGNSEENRFKLGSGAYAEWIKELLDALGIKEAIVVGNSLGSWMALDFAVKYPERVKKLVLLASSGIAPIHTAFADKTLAVAGGEKPGNADEAVLGEGIPQAVMEFMNLILDNFIPMTEEMPVFSDSELGRLKMPAFLALGENDAIIDAQSSAERFSRLVPTAEVQVIKNCGHVIMGAAELILPFLNK